MDLSKPFCLFSLMAVLGVNAGSAAEPNFFMDGMHIRPKEGVTKKEYYKALKKEYLRLDKIKPGHGRVEMSSEFQEKWIASPRVGDRLAIFMKSSFAGFKKVTKIWIGRDEEEDSYEAAFELEEQDGFKDLYISVFFNDATYQPKYESTGQYDQSGTNTGLSLNEVMDLLSVSESTPDYSTNYTVEQALGFEDGDLEFVQLRGKGWREWSKEVFLLRTKNFIKEMKGYNFIQCFRIDGSYYFVLDGGVAKGFTASSIEVFKLTDQGLVPKANFIYGDSC